MPLIRINADGATARPEHGSLVKTIERAAGPLPQTAPSVLMIHGYKHSPYDAAHDPHAHILSLDPRRRGRNLSWPKHLGFGRRSTSEGLAVAFGWNARGSIWQAYRTADMAAVALAETITALRSVRCNPVDIIAHSLGARTALGAIRRLPEGAIGRVILLSGAEFAHHGTSAVQCPAGQTAEFLNVTSRENALFDLMFQRLLQPPWRMAPALGRGLPTASPNWVDLRIDCPMTRAHLLHLGFRIPPPARAICHWSGYMRPGLFPLYRAFLRERENMPLGDLSAPPIPDQPLRQCDLSPLFGSCTFRPLA